MKILQGKHIKLRAPEPEDLEILYKWENDTDLWQVSNTITPFSRFTLRQYLEIAHLDIYENHQLRLMIDTFEKDDSAVKTIGAIDLFDFDPYHSRAGVGILIGDNSSRGKGYADDALSTLIHYCFEVLCLNQLFCNIGTENKISLKLFTNKGFEIIGEKKKWLKTPNGWCNEYLLQLINPQ